LDGVFETVHVGDDLLHHQIVFDTGEELVHGVFFGDDGFSLFEEFFNIQITFQWGGDLVVEVVEEVLDGAGARSGAGA